MPDWFKEGVEAALLAPTAINQQKFKIGIKDGERNQYNLLLPNKDAADPYTWNISYYPSGHSITGTDYFTPDSYIIWSPGYVVSPEIFIAETIKPGETLTYAREWNFE